MTTAAKKQSAVAITLPSPFWWFVLAGTPLAVVEEVAGRKLFPEHLAHRGPLYIHASAAFDWGLVKDDAEDLIRALNWRRKPDLWPSMYDMQKSIGRVVGMVDVNGPKRGPYSLALPTFLSPIALCADGFGVFPISAGTVAQIKSGAAA